MFRKLGRFIARYFSFFAGFLFVFVLGLVYALFRPGDIWANTVFILLIVGLVIYLIRSLWEVLEEEKKQDFADDAELKIIESSEENKKS